MNVNIRNMIKLTWRKSVALPPVKTVPIEDMGPQYALDILVADLPCSEKSLKRSIGLVDKI